MCPAHGLYMESVFGPCQKKKNMYSVLLCSFEFNNLLMDHKQEWLYIKTERLCRNHMIIFQLYEPFGNQTINRHDHVKNILVFGETHTGKKVTWIWEADSQMQMPCCRCLAPWSYCHSEWSTEEPRYNGGVLCSKIQLLKWICRYKGSPNIEVW